MLRAVLKFGLAMDALRVWPRCFMLAYAWGLFIVLDWYLHQPAASWDKTGFAALYSGLCAPLLKWYMENGVDWAAIFPAIFHRRAPPCAAKE